MGMNLQTTISIYAYHPLELWDTELPGFANWQKELIRAVLSRIPPYLLTNFKAIIPASGLGAKHGRYDEDTHVIRLNPRDFRNRVAFGRGPGRKLPHVELTIAHEVGHSIYYFLSPREMSAWKRLSGWQVGPGEGQAPPYTEKRSGWPKETAKETHREGAEFVRRYAERNDHEDFADSFAFYVMGQKDRLPPEKRAFFVKMFHDFKRERPKGLQ